SSIFYSPKITIAVTSGYRFGMELSPVPNRRADCHVAWIRSFVSVHFVFAGAACSQLCVFVVGKHWPQPRFVGAASNLIAKPVRPAGHAFVQLIQMLRD